VDSSTEQKYISLTCAYGERIRQSIDSNPEPHFRLDENERCPHLNRTGLCNIITEVGEDYLCDICREHPRFYNYTAHAKEVGIGMACEEACRIILGSDRYDTFIEIEEINDENDVFFCEYDATAYRNEIFSTLSNASISYTDKLKSIEKSFAVSTAGVSDAQSRELLSSLEYLSDSHKELFSCYTSSAAVPKEIEKELERALAYFVFRHCSDAENEDELRASLGFCLFCERLLASAAAASNARDSSGIAELARIVSEEIEYSEDNTAAITLLFFEER